MASSSPIFPSNQGMTPSFAQQGQVDWVAFGNTAWNMTSATLQRFSASEIQPATYGAAIALGCRFALGVTGKTRVGDALQQLQGSPSFRKILWFGFGYQSFVHMLATTQPGFNCLALCACLVETHPPDVAATILTELWKVCDFPDEYEPSHAQFLNLVNACSGVLARTPFGVTVERMAGRRWEYNQRDTGASRNWEICAIPKDIAAVLSAMFDISKGKMESIVVAGATECAFIGAIAQWLFDFEVQFEGDVANEGLYPQVLIQFDDMSGNIPSSSVTTLRSTSFYLNNTDDYWSQISSGDALESSLILRVPWENCLSQTFGRYFEELCSCTYALAEFLGSAASIYSAFAMGEEDVGDFENYREIFMDIVDTCYGSGLVHTIINVFPELQNRKDLFKTMQRFEGISFSDAVKAFQNSYVAIMLRCKCAACDQEFNFHRHNNKKCLLAIAYTILRLARFLGAVKRDPTLHPTISGIRHFYYLAPQKHGRESNSDIQFTSKLLHLILSEEYWEEGSNDYMKQNSNQSLEQYLNDPLALFSGACPIRKDKGLNRMRGESSLPLAVSWRGICSYLSGLNDLTSQPEQLRVVHVLPGHIQRGNRPYRYVYDYPEMSDIRRQRERWSDYNTLDPNGDLGEACYEARAVVTEQPGALGLYFSYNVHFSPKHAFHKDLLPPLSIAPGWLTFRVLRISCNIACKGGILCDKAPLQRQLCPNNQRMPLDLSTGELTFQGHLAWTVSTPEADDMDRCIALQVHSLSNVCEQTQVLIRRHECLPCCSRAAVKLSAHSIMQTLSGGSGRSPDVVFHVISI